MKPDPELIGRALPALGLVGTMGLFLPSLTDVWHADPHDAGLLHKRLRTGETLYLGTAGAILILASYAARSPWPLVIGSAFVGAILWTYERAYAEAPRAHHGGEARA